MEVGDTFAMLNRTSCAEDCGRTTVAESVFVTRISDQTVVIHDIAGHLIDDTANFTPLGLQPYQATDGDNALG